MKVLAYFDLFHYPVTADEVLFFLDQETGREDLLTALDELTGSGTIFRLEGFYSLRNESPLVERRLKGNRHAEQLLRIAARTSRFLYQFPYVRGIGISGSLSKKFADEHADIDYFIITRSNRLWIARTLMHVFKKLSYLTGRQHWYCMNYYVDESALEIEEKNIFTATELITLLPVCGNGGLVKFFDANDWVNSFLPHYKHRQRQADAHPPAGLIKRTLEWIFDNRLGDRLDDLFRKITSRRWKAKEERGAVTGKGYTMSLKNDKHYSRPNPEMLQRRILMNYSDRLRKLII